MVKKLLTSFLLCIICLPMCADTLSEIWQLCRENSAELQYRQNEIDYAYSNKQADRDRGISPMLNLGVSVSIPKGYEVYESSLPWDFEENLTIKKGITSSTAIVLSLKNTLNNRNSAGTNIYNRNTSLSLTLNQSLCPYWLQGESMDPYSQKLEATVLLSRYSREIAEQKLLIDVTQLYLNARKYAKLIELARKTVEIYNGILDIFESMEGDVSIELLNASMEYRDYRWDAILNLGVYKAGYADLLMQLTNMCGREVMVDYMDLLPDYSVPLYNHNPEEKDLKTKILLVELDSKLKRQEIAPQLTLSGNISMSNSLVDYSDYWKAFSSIRNYSWYVSMGLDLSSFLSSSSKLAENAYKKKLADLKVRQSEMKIRDNSYVRFLSSMRQEAEERKIKALEMAMLYQRRLEQLRQMQEIGTINEIEALLYEMKTLNMINAVTNAEDDVWFYSWLETNYMKQ